GQGKGGEGRGEAGCRRRAADQSFQGESLPRRDVRHAGTDGHVHHGRRRGGWQNAALAAPDAGHRIGGHVRTRVLGAAASDDGERLADGALPQGLTLSTRPTDSAAATYRSSSARATGP